jgi:hypothetical protein
LFFPWYFCRFFLFSCRNVGLLVVVISEAAMKSYIWHFLQFMSDVIQWWIFTKQSFWCYCMSLILSSSTGNPNNWKNNSYLVVYQCEAPNRFIVHSLDHLCFVLSSELWKLFATFFLALSSLLNLFFLLLWIPYGEVKKVTSKIFFHFLEVLPHTSSYFYREK